MGLSTSIRKICRKVSMLMQIQAHFAAPATAKLLLILRVATMAVIGWALVPKCIATEAAAAEPVPIDVAISAYVREDYMIDGVSKQRLVPASEISEGTEVYYTVAIRNAGDRPAHNVVVIKAVPINTVYVANSATAPGAATTFSTDGGTTFAAPTALVAKDADGRSVRMGTERYTHIRWHLRYPLAPGATAYARFRAIFR